MKDQNFENKPQENFDPTRAYKNVILAAHVKAREGQLTEVENKILKTARQSDTFGEFTRDLDKKFPIESFRIEQNEFRKITGNRVMDSIVLKMGDKQEDTKILQGNEINLPELLEMFKNPEFEKEAGKIKNVTEVDTQKDGNELSTVIKDGKIEKARWDVDKATEYMDGEILPKGEGEPRIRFIDGDGGENPDVPQWYPERLEYLEGICTGRIVSITTSKYSATNPARYFGFEITTQNNQKFMVCDSQKYGNRIYIFKIENQEYKKDIQLTKDKAKISGSFVKRLNHNLNYQDRFEKFLNL